MSVAPAPLPRPSEIERMPWVARERLRARLERETIDAARRNWRILTTRGPREIARVMLADLPTDPLEVVAQRRAELRAVHVGVEGRPMRAIVPLAERILATLPPEDPALVAQRRAVLEALSDDEGCEVPGCGREVFPRCRQPWCEAHYRRWLKKGDVEAHIPVRARRKAEAA